MLEQNKYRILSLSFASYTSIFLALIPVIYVSNGFTPEQIAILSSMYTFGAIVQTSFSPVTLRLGIKRTLLFNLSVLVISCLFLFLFNNFVVYLIFVTMYYIFQAPNIGLIDNFLKLISEQQNIKFGTLRAFVSAGWGLGTILALPFMYYFTENSLLLLIVGLILITLMTISVVRVEEVKGETQRLFRIDILKNRDYRKILFISTLIMGVWSIKSSYQTLLILDKTTSVYIVSLISVISIMMELLIIPRVEKLYSLYGYKKLLSVAACAGMILTFGYYYFDSIFIIIVLASLHGVLCGIMIPLNVFKVRETVSEIDFDSAMLTMYSIQNLFAFILIILVVNQIYVLLNIELVFLFLSAVLLFVIVINSRMNYTCKERTTRL